MSQLFYGRVTGDESDLYLLIPVGESKFRQNISFVHDRVNTRAS